MSTYKLYSFKHVVTLPAKQVTRFYGVCFNNYDSDNTVFAVVGGRYIIIVRLDNEKPVALNVVQKYVAESKDEDFYCCAWSVDPNTGAPLLAVAGAARVIQIISTSVGSIIETLKGHGGEINEIKIHPRDPSLLFSASKDLSIRLWNLKTMQTVAIFAGECGHREAPLSIDVHLSGDFLASSGMDHTIKIWSLCTPVVKHAIESSFSDSSPSSSSSSRPSLSQGDQKSCCSSYGTSSKTVIVHYPIFSTARLHNNYVDCIRWYGDLLLSRCANDAKIVMWKPDVELVASDKSNVTSVVVGGPAAPSKQQSGFDIICEFEFNNCDLWFLRFGMSYDFQVLATGNQAGKIYLWNMQDIPDYIDYYIEKKKEEVPVIINEKAINEKTVAKKKKGNKKTNNKTKNKTNKKTNNKNNNKTNNKTNSNANASASASGSSPRKKPIILNSPTCDHTIRQIGFSNDRQWIVAVCDDGSFWCWKGIGNRITKRSANNVSIQISM